MTAQELKDLKASEGKYFVYNAKILYAAIAVALGTLLAIICGLKSVQRKVPVNYVLGYTFALSMCYICGFVTFKYSANAVLAAFGVTLIMTILLAIFGGKIVSKLGRRDQIKKALGPTFGILGSVVVLVLIIFFVVKNPDGKASFSLLPTIGLFCLGFFYLLFDTFAIVNGKYSNMVSAEDYIYGSSKLFADFVLMLTLLTHIFGS